MHRYKKSYLIILLLATLGACSDNNSESEQVVADDADPTEGNPVDDADPIDSTVLTGVFIDSAVMGINYATDTQSGVTNDSGTFDYLSGEQITFSIGALRLPTITAQEVVSPVDLAAGSDDPAAMTTNIARLLQSLDLDANPDNGIVISSQAAQSAAPIDFNVSESAFETNPDVINLVANSGSMNTSLISAAEANAHLSDTLFDTNAVVDLRNSVWISGGSVTGCDGKRSTYTLTYSQTGLTTNRVSFEADADGVCQPVEIAKSEESFEALVEQPEFLLTCGDGLCEAGELDQRVSLAADDSRNDCTDINGEPVADERVIIASGNTESFTYRRCTNTGFDVEVFLLQ